MKKQKNTLILDVGGSHTRLLLIHDGEKDFKEKILPTDKDRLIKQTRAFLKKIRPGTIHAGFRGVWAPAEKTVWRKKLAPLADKVLVQSDIELAFKMTYGPGSGVILNAGTGSIAYGRNADGEWARAGGLGPLLGDEGSAFWIGKEALKWGYNKDRNLLKIRKYLHGPKNVSQIAKLGFETVSRYYTTEAPPLRAIITAAHDHLAFLIHDVLKQLNWKGQVPIALRGGLFQHPKFKSDFLKVFHKIK